MQRKLETSEQIFQFLLTLQPTNREYELVKRFVGEDISQTIAYLKKKNLALPPEMRNLEQYIIDRWNEFVSNKDNPEYDVERQLLAYGKRIVNIEKLYQHGRISECLELLEKIEKDADEDKVSDYVFPYTKPLRNRIENHEYIAVDKEKSVVNKNFIIYDIECELIKRGVGSEQARDIASKLFTNIEEHIEDIVRIAGRNSDKIKKINETIHENIKKIPQELLDYYLIKAAMEPICFDGTPAEAPFTDEEVKMHAHIFEKLKNLFEKIKDTLCDSERTQGENMIARLESKFYRPYPFVSVIKKDGHLCATVEGDVARAKFLEYVKENVIARGYDEESVNKAVGIVLRGEISWRLPWAKVEQMIEKCIDDVAHAADVEITRKKCLSLAEEAKKCNEIDEGILLIKDMELLFEKTQNKTYSTLGEEFKNAYGAYLLLSEKIMKKIEQSSMPPEQKYKKLKELNAHTHKFNDGDFESLKTRLDALTFYFAKNMIESVSETKIIKNKIRFWSGIGMEVAGLTIFGLGIAFAPFVAPFGLAILPAGMKLMKDGLDLREKYDGFVRKRKKTETTNQNKQLKRQ
ncbi:MAG: hypothetical protein QXY05_03095 [Candidatus Anstonellales archaeon]